MSRLTRFDERLKKFNPAQLSPRSAIDLRLLQATIKRELLFSKELGVYEHNPIIYAAAIDVNVFARRRYAPIEDRVRSITAVENQAANVVIAAKTNLVEVLPRPYVELAIQIARDSADFLKKNLIETLADLKDDNLRAGFLQSNRRAANALTDYAAWLERDRLPKATAPFAIGRDKYQRFLSQTELIDLSLERILEIGEAELKHEEELFADAAKRIEPDKPAAEVFQKIKEEHPTMESLLPDTGKAMEAVRKYVADQKLVTIPTEVRPQIKEAPPYFRAFTLAAMDGPGPFDRRAVDAFFYVTTPDKEWSEQSKQDWLSALNNYSTSVLAMGETFPGRYVQELHLNASKATKPEKIFAANSFVRGWTHYCEKVTVDAGFPNRFGPSPTDEEIQQAAKYRMAQAHQAIISITRLVASIKMHTQDMPVDEASALFQKSCFLDPKLARLEALRATFDLGYPFYTLGKLQILKLRNDYEAQEGENFSLKKFHDELLDNGMLPLRLLREIMLKDQLKWDETF